MAETDSVYNQILDSGYFKADWYLSQYQDVAAANQDSLEHYLLYGVSEGRNPGPDFSTSGFLARYRDVAEAGINPLLHYIRDGQKEGRLTTPCLDPRHQTPLWQFWRIPFLFHARSPGQGAFRNAGPGQFQVDGPGRPLAVPQAKRM